MKYKNTSELNKKKVVEKVVKQNKDYFVKILHFHILFLFLAFFSSLSFSSVLPLNFTFSFCYFLPFFFIDWLAHCSCEFVIHILKYFHHSGPVLSTTRNAILSSLFLLWCFLLSNHIFTDLASNLTLQFYDH